jgi:hypothetical protein
MVHHPRSDTSHHLHQSCGTTLAAVLVSVLAAGLAAESRAAEIAVQPIPAPYAKTLVVEPVPGSPGASGKALIAALKKLDLKKPGRWLVKLEPGVYDLGEQPLVLRPGIDVEGSGTLQTEIVGLGQDFSSPDFSFRKGVVIGAADVELRHLTVRCQNTNQLNACIVMANYQASPHLTDVRLLATDAEGEGHWGLRNDESSPVLDKVEILVANGISNYALVNTFAGSRPEIRRTSLTAQNGTDQNVGVFNKVMALPELHSVDIDLVGGRIAAGVWTIQTEDEEIERGASTLPTLTMFDVDIEARDAQESFGVLGGQLTIELRNSRVTVDRGSALDVGPVGSVDVLNSELRATDFLAHADRVRIVATWLRGGGDVLGYSEETCLGVHTDEGTSDICP